MAIEHFAAKKEQLSFKVNNIDFMVQHLEVYSLKKCRNDLSLIQRRLDETVD